MLEFEGLKELEFEGPKRLRLRLMVLLSFEVSFCLPSLSKQTVSSIPPQVSFLSSSSSLLAHLVLFSNLKKRGVAVQCLFLFSIRFSLDCIRQTLSQVSALVRPCVVFEWSMGTLVVCAVPNWKRSGWTNGSLQRLMSSGNKDLHCSYITFTQERFTFSSSMPHMGQFFLK